MTAASDSRECREGEGDGEKEMGETVIQSLFASDTDRQMQTYRHTQRKTDR